jgi:histidinol-phosphate aminotransferase
VNRIVKLSSNEGAFGPPPAAVEAIRAMAAEAHRYPDGGAKALREAIGARFGLDPARIVSATGRTNCSPTAHPRLWRRGHRAGDERAWLHDVRHHRPLGRLPHHQGAGEEPDHRCGRHARRGRAAHAAGVPGEPEQPDRVDPAAGEVERLRAGLRDDILLVLDSAYAEYVTRPDYDAGRSWWMRRATP